MNYQDNLHIRGILRTLSEDDGQSIESKEQLLRLIKVLKEELGFEE